MDVRNIASNMIMAPTDLVLTGVTKGVTGVSKGVHKGVTGVSKGVSGVSKGVTKGVTKGVSEVSKGVNKGVSMGVHGINSAVSGVTGRGRNPRNKLQRQNSRLAWDSRVTAPYIKLDLIIECRRLPKKDSFSQADAFCGLWEVPPGFAADKKVSRLPVKQEKEVGRTEVVRENKNPRFTTTFRLEYKFQEVR